jgi:hypothetical protein
MGDLVRDLKRLLRDNGCSFKNYGRGDHENWYSPITQTHFTVDAGMKSRHSANGVLKQAGIEKSF